MTATHHSMMNAKFIWLFLCRKGMRELLTGLLLVCLMTLFLLAPVKAAGALNIGVQLEPPNLDPTSGAAAAIDEIVYANLFEGLTRLDESGTVQPALAKSWSVSPDGLTYDFLLREHVRFHDDSPFNAEDVVFSLNRAKAPDSTNAQRVIFEKIDRVIAIEANRVQVQLTEPLGAFTTYLGWGDAVIISAKTASSNAHTPVGTGPFKFLRWRKGASVSLIHNTDYWGTPAALDQLNFIFIPDPTAAFAALMAGDVDGFPNYPAPENLALIKNDKRFQVSYGTGEGEIIVAINNAKVPLDNLKVRRALNHAINKKDVIKAALFDQGTPIGSHFPPHHPAYMDLADHYPYDPARAKKLLDETGYQEGFELTLALPPPAYARRSGEVVAAQLEAIGIKVKIENIEWAQWLEQIFTDKNYDLTIVSHTEPLDIDIYARDDYYFSYKNPGFNHIIARLQREDNHDRRMSLYKQAQTTIAEDAVNIFLASSPKISVWSKNVTGIWEDAPLQANDLTKADIVGRTKIVPNTATGRTLPIGPILTLLMITGLTAIAVLTKASPVFLAMRAFSLLISLIFASIIIFVLMEVAPGDPARFMMGLNADPASVAALRTELGLDQPAIARYFSWISGFLNGDLGTSYTYRVPVGTLITERIGISLPLALLAFSISTAIGIPAGLVASNRRQRGGQVVTALAQAGVAIPNFWLAILLVMMFAVSFRWFSAGGFPGWEAGFFPALKALLLPAIALAVPQAAILTQIMRSSMMNTLNDDYIRTARAKGLSYHEVLKKHALRNAIIPTLTILGLQFSFLLAGGIIVENVFYLPGLGRLVFQSIIQRDLIVVKNIVMVLVFSVISIAFIVDFAYSIADPRLRSRGRT